jgi:hypothetical protein
MDESDDARRKRAEQRRSRITRVEAGEDVPLPETGLARMELAWALTKAAWAMSGRPLPSYSRAEMPGRVIRRDEG